VGSATRPSTRNTTPPTCSPMPLAITLGAGRPSPTPCRRSEHQWPGHHAVDQAQGQGRPEVMEGSCLRCHSTTRCTIISCVGRRRSRARPDQDIGSARAARPEMVGNLRADNIDGF
jgi:hypothetical protein